MQFEQTNANQASQRAGDQSRGSWVDHKPAAKHQPTQQPGGDCMEETDDETYNAGRKEMLGVVVPE